jgi:hypothetical protein
MLDWANLEKSPENNVELVKPVNMILKGTVSQDYILS